MPSEVPRDLGCVGHIRTLVQAGNVWANYEKSASAAPHGHSTLVFIYQLMIIHHHHLLSRLALDGLALGTMLSCPIADSEDVSLLKNGRTSGQRRQATVLVWV